MLRTAHDQVELLRQEPTRRHALRRSKKLACLTHRDSATLRARAVRMPDSRPKFGRTPERDAPKPVCRRRSASLSGSWTRLDPALYRWGPLDPAVGGKGLATDPRGLFADRASFPARPATRRFADTARPLAVRPGRSLVAATQGAVRRPPRDPVRYAPRATRPTPHPLTAACQGRRPLALGSPGPPPLARTARGHRR